MKYKKKSTWTAAVSLIMALVLTACAATPGVPDASGDEPESAASDSTSIDPASLESFTGNTFESGGVTYSLKDFSYAETTEGKFLLQLFLDIKGGSSVLVSGRFKVSANPDFSEVLDSELSMDNDGLYVLKAECASVPDTLYLETPVTNLCTETDIVIDDLSALDISYDTDVGPGGGTKLCVVSFESGDLPVFPFHAKLVSSGEEYAMANSNIGFTSDGTEVTDGIFQFSVPEGWTVTDDTSFVITEKLTVVKPVLWQVNLSQFGQEAAAAGTAEPLNDEQAFSDDAQIMVEKQNGFYIISVLDDLSVEKTGDGQYDISYTVGAGVAVMPGVSCEYNPSFPYLPLLAADSSFENLIDIACTNRVDIVGYTSDTIKLEAGDIRMGSEEQRNGFIGTYLKSSVYVSCFSGTIKTDADVLYVSTPGIIMADYSDRRALDKDLYEINYDAFEESGIIGVTTIFDRPEYGSPLIGKPRTLALVIDGTEYKSDRSNGHASGEQYTKTYGIKVPEGVSLEDGYSLIGYDYESLVSPHVFEIDLSAYAN